MFRLYYRNVHMAWLLHKCIYYSFHNATLSSLYMCHRSRNAKYKSLARLHPNKKNTNIFHHILCTCILLRYILKQLFHNHRVIHTSFLNHLLSEICIPLYFEWRKLKGFLYRHHSEGFYNLYTHIPLHMVHYFLNTCSAYYDNQIYNCNV